MNKFKELLEKAGDLQFIKKAKDYIAIHKIAVVTTATTAAAGIEVEFEGEGVNEIAKDKATGKVVLKVNPDFFRPAEVELLIGNPAKAEAKLGWKREISFQELVERMVKNDLELVKKEAEANN